MISTRDVPEKILTDEDINARINFHKDLQVMECDFSDLHLSTQPDVNRFYDHLEARIAETGEKYWYFLINYSNARIDPIAWIAFARRGKTLNLAHSQGSVRLDASAETRRQIEKSAGTENFDPNLFADRNEALKRLQSLPSKRRTRVVHDPNYATSDFVRRVEFIAKDQILDIDFSDFTFWTSRDVDDFYDFLEARVKETDQKWFFLVNLHNCRIMPEAWIQYARRGKRFNIAASLGSVRYAPGSENEEEIRQRAQSQDFKPNLRNTREEALERIAEIKQENAKA